MSYETLNSFGVTTLKNEETETRDSISITITTIAEQAGTKINTDLLPLLLFSPELYSAVAKAIAGLGDTPYDTFDFPDTIEISSVIPYEALNKEDIVGAVYNASFYYDQSVNTAILTISINYIPNILAVENLLKSSLTYRVLVTLIQLYNKTKEDVSNVNISLILK